MPWLVVWLAPITIRASIHSIPVLIGWLLVVLAAFSLLVLLPIAALLCGGAALRQAAAAGLTETLSSYRGTSSKRVFRARAWLIGEIRAAAS